MNSRFIRVLSGVGLLFWVIGSQAQDSVELPELANWQFSENINLSDAMLQDSRLDAMFIGEILLISHPNLDSGNDCGSVMLLSPDSNGRFNLIRTLSAADFNRSCNTPDGFGFSVDHQGELLVIGAPDQIFIEPGEVLQRGAVYIYGLDASNTETAIDTLQPLDRVGGTFQRGNVAWGTRVKTDGERILVQGNETSGNQFVQGRARSRSVNLLERQSGNDWRLTQQFSNDATVYGQDFLIKEGIIVISSHAFNQFIPGFLTPSVNRYDSSLEVYELDGVSSTLRQTIPFLNVLIAGLGGPGSDSLQTLNQLYWRAGKLILFAALTNISELTEISRFELNQDNLFQQIGEPVRQFRTVKHVGDQVVFLFGSNQREAAISDFSLTREDFGKQLQQQIVSGSGNQTIIVFQGAQFNISNNHLVLVNGPMDARQISVFDNVPALDPVITGAWWFGLQFDGQGITLEVLRGNRLLLHWFTYDLSGNQMWMRGTGVLNNGMVNMTLNRARGPRFPIGQFRPSDRVVDQWGTVEIRFNDCRNGQLTYQSDEFGSDSLSITPLFNNRFLCNRGFFVNEQGNRAEPAAIAGSSFDQSRGGEGIIFMPIANNTDVTSSLQRVRSDMLGFWLTYNTQGEQAWYYLGRYTSDRCGGSGCPWFSLEQPRSTTGPVFGPGYDPSDRVTVPWGRFGPLESVRARQRSVEFSNPDGSGQLILEELTDPIGY